MPSNGGFYLPRTARLRRRAEYRRVYASGTRVAGRFMVVFALPRPGRDGKSRLGVTATRKVGGAVVRARCKRRLREVFRLHPEELSGLTVDVVVNARHGCADAPWEELRRDYTKSVRRLREQLGNQ